MIQFDKHEMNEVKDFNYTTPLELFKEKKVVKICAPMVRYSKYVTFSCYLKARIFETFLMCSIHSLVKHNNDF